MARAYSQDLRDRVIDAALGGMPARQAAAQFEIGVATAIVWVRRARASGEADGAPSGPATALQARSGHLIGTLIDAFSPQECANYFAAAGYDPD
jgi:transposase-like protein